MQTRSSAHLELAGKQLGAILRACQIVHDATHQRQVDRHLWVRFHSFRTMIIVLFASAQAFPTSDRTGQGGRRTTLCREACAWVWDDGRWHHANRWNPVALQKS